MPTSVSGMGDVVAELHAGEMYAGRRLVGGSTRGVDRIGDAGDVQDPAAVRHEPTGVQGRARMEDERAERLRLRDAVDGGAAVSASGVLAACEDDRDRGAVRRRQ